MTIFQQSSSTFGNTNSIVVKGFMKLNSHLLGEGIARLTEQVNMLLENFASSDYHLPFPHYPS